jgi:membrane-bound metal-dependent hydrolase YbcI (DUF457 family)
MGRTHAAVSVGAWMAVAPVLADRYHQDPWQLLVGGALACGAGMLPDTDMPRSNFGRTYGPLTRWPCEVVGWAAGGHRQGTHSLLGILVFTVFAVMVARAGGWVLAVAVWMLLGAGCRALGLGGPRTRVVVVHALTMGLVTLGLVVTAVDVGVVFPAAVLVGCVTHVAADTLTDGGCPWGWPSQAGVGVPVFATGGPVEPLVGPVVLVGGVFMVVWRSGWVA